MKADEKQLIFNLLKNASAHFNGYTKDVYKSEQNFTDDEENQCIKQENLEKLEQTTIQTPIESQSQQQSAVQVQSQNEILEQNQTVFFWQKHFISFCYTKRLIKFIKAGPSAVRTYA